MDASRRHESLVTIDFKPADGGTEVLLKYENLVSQEEADAHRNAGLRGPCQRLPAWSIFTHMGEYRKPGMDRVLGAIADPTRRAILARLAESDARVTEVAAAFPISLNSVSKHVRKLEDAGLVRREVRGREHLLSLNAAPLSEAAAWIAHYQRFWEDSLAALDEYVTGRKTKQRKPK